MRSATFAIPIFAGFLLAQHQSRTEITTTKTTWNGVLVDAACHTTHTERKESIRQNDGQHTTRTTHMESVDCPVTSSTNSFGLLTADGRYLRFDDPSNTRVVEIVRSNREFERSLADHSPLKVKILGTANGDIAVVESLNPEATTIQSTQVAADIWFDVKYHDDHGKLVVTDRGVNFENVSNAKHSRSWTYSQIKEFKRDGDEIKIDPYSGDSFEFHVKGKAMSEEVYRTIANRIVAARGR